MYRKNLPSYLRLLTFMVLTLISCKTQPEKKLSLNRLFSDHMVLQQNKEVSFWGTYTPKEKITLSTSWDEGSLSSVADNKGQWKLNVSTPKAGGPYEVTISTKDSTIVLNDVLIGEVWLASGQSNMQMPLKGWPPNDPIDNSEQEIANADYRSIRMFNVERNYSLKLIDTVAGQWMVCSPKTAGEFSATAYFFAKRLHKELTVPIGIIHSSWGGTVAEAWTSKNELKTLDDFKKNIADIENPEVWERTKQWYSALDSIDYPGTIEAWNNLNFDDEELAGSDFDDKNWEDFELPNRFDQFEDWELNGAVWFRKDIEINDVTSDYVLSAGIIDDMDATYFNGKKVGGLAGWGYHTAERIYTVPKELLKKGKNTVAIRAIDAGGPGTITGTLKLSNEKVVSIPLNGTWKILPITEIYNGKFYKYNSNTTDLSQRPNILQMGPNLPSVLYNAMIHPLIPYTIKGAIWYQGESNVGRAEQYERLFPKMINDWRNQWEEDFSFYFVQIAPYNYGIPPENEGSVALRDAQRKSLATKNTGMVVTLDIGNYTNIHPGNKQDVGKRLAGLALADNYGKDIIASGPLYKSHKISEDKMLLTFDHVGSGLKAKDSELSGFEIAGADKKYVSAKAMIIDNTIELSAATVPNPVYARYAWSDKGAASLFNKEGLPASAFTTEN